MPETRNQQRIRELLGDEEPEKDNSLRGKSLARASNRHIPNTLTPWEWQEWYAEHGQPAEHLQRLPAIRKPWWHRLLRRK